MPYSKMYVERSKYVVVIYVITFYIFILKLLIYFSGLTRTNV